MKDVLQETREKLLEGFVSHLGPAIGAGAFKTLPKSFRDIWSASGLTASDFAARLATFLTRPVVTFEQLSKSKPLCDRFSPRFLREFGAFPYLDPDDGPSIALAEPPDIAFQQAAQIVLEAAPRYVIASYEDISAILSAQLQTADAETPDAAAGPGSADDVENLRDLASGAPVVRAISELCEKAVELRATDLHIEPMRETLSIRLRVDGVLRPVPAPPMTMAAALISRIKILAGLNIAERRIPQDGSARLRVGNTQVDVRVAILPTQHGESAVLRFLPVDRGLLDLARLGLSERSEQTLKRLLQSRNGMIIISGPTGSGKTTTLAGALTQINDTSRKIITVEDPIEYELTGITQSQINPAVGLTFATALRAFLRFDPNVIMVGEVRDSETAQIAVQAALTGHLLLTTLHTETAAAVVPRLIDLGVEDFLLQSTLRAVIAQRLLRRLCESCKRSLTLTRDMMDADPQYSVVGLTPGEIICEPVGCERCGNSGYRGRSGVFEILEATPDLRPLIRRGVDGPSIDAHARQHGFLSMMDDALSQIRNGRTTAAEALRVIPVR